MALYVIGLVGSHSRAMAVCSATLAAVLSAQRLDLGEVPGVTLAGQRRRTRETELLYALEGERRHRTPLRHIGRLDHAPARI
jgi:hypothetical protein